MFSATDNMEAEGDKLNIFLNSCLKQTKHVTEVRQKLDDEGIDYDTLYELHEEDFRSTLKDDLGIKNYRVGLMVKAMGKIDDSGVQTNPAGSGASGFVVLTEKQNDYILKIQGNEDTVKKNIEKLETATDDIHKNTKTVTTHINDYYHQLSNILKQQQKSTLNTLETIKTGKLSMIKRESDTANEALHHLEKSDEDFKRILNDKKLDITKKHGTITQHIETSQNGLLKYDGYLQKDMSLPTKTKIEYDAKNKQLFEEFMQHIDDVIDADISFTKIEFVENDAVIIWKSDLDKIKDATFVLQFRTLNKDEGDDEKKEEYQWKVLQVLEPNQSKVSLDADIIENKEENKDDIKHDEDEGRLGVLNASTAYQFRIVVSILNNRIYSSALSVTTPEFCRLKSSIITRTEERILMDWIPNANRCTFRLLFRGSRDGFTAAAFHEKCDGKNTNISIIRSTNDHVFGGYTNKSWNKHTQDYIRDDTGWLYLLRSAKGDEARVFPMVKNPQNAIYSYASYGPSYGNGHDLYIADGCNTNQSSHAYPNNVYIGATDNTQLAGSYNFQVADYEVWQIQDYDENKFINSTLINEAEVNQLMKWIPNCNDRRFVSLFDSKVDGFASATFHTKCDAFGPTLTIIQSTNNHIFGGYVEQPWHILGNYSQDNNAWLYSLRNAKGNVPKKLDIYKAQSHALYGDNSYGPIYGGNWDLCIADGCNANSSSSVNLGYSYRGVEDPYQLAGSNTFQVTNYEVWGILEPGSNVMESNILNQQEFEALNEWIKASGYMHYRLLLRGSVDGFGAAVFHQKCDNKGKTLVIVRSESNYVFGGYTEVSWKSIGNYKADPNAWIYLLRNPNGDQPEQWYPTKNVHSIYTNDGYGATFGSGHDFYLSDGCNANNSSYSGLGTTYSADQSQTKLAGAYNFKVTEYEVWQIC